MPTLKDKTLIITGASRGIGLAIALRAARDGANIVIAAKTVDPHPKLPGTIHTAADAVREAGGNALALPLDLRDDDGIAQVVAETVSTFGSIDGLVNNAGAIHLAGSMETPMKRFDLMMDVNVRGTFAISQACLPHLIKSKDARILIMAPPLNTSPRWIARHLPYTLSKYGMSMCVIGLAEEFRKRGIVVNGLWPRTVIDTSSLNHRPDVDIKHCRRPEIVADAAHELLTRDSGMASGHLYSDEEVLREAGMEDFSSYACEPGQPLLSDLFID